MITVYLYRAICDLLLGNKQSYMRHIFFIIYYFFLFHRPSCIFCAVQDEHASVFDRRSPFIFVLLKSLRRIFDKLSYSNVTGYSLDRAQATCIKCLEVNQIRIFILDFWRGLKSHWSLACIAESYGRSLTSHNPCPSY